MRENRQLELLYFPIIGKGARQGRIVSPHLLQSAHEYVMRKQKCKTMV